MQPITRLVRGHHFSHHDLLPQADGAGCVAGLAALFFLLDGNTYFLCVCRQPCFMLSLSSPVVSYEHHQWRSAKSRSGLVLSALFLALSLLADEGGASTFAFILAYALVLEPVLFATGVDDFAFVAGHRPVATIYTLSGFGVFHLGITLILPASRSIWRRVVIPRAIALSRPAYRRAAGFFNRR